MEQVYRFWSCVILSFCVALPAAAAEWRLVFEDGFERPELGDDYDVARAEFARIEDGQLLFAGRFAHVYIDRPFKMDVRIEFDCMAWPERPPCDLGMFMNEAYIVSFGARENRANHIHSNDLNAVDLEPPFVIEPGKRYHIVAQREGKRISYTVNDTLAIEGESDDLLGGPSFDRHAFMTYGGMMVDHVKVYERSEPHPETKVYMTEFPEIPLYRDGREVKARVAVSDTARKAIKALNAGDFDQAKQLFGKEADLAIRMLGLAHVLADVRYDERPAYGRYHGGEDYGELGALEKRWEETAKANPGNALLQALVPALKHFGKLPRNKRYRNDARMLVELGPDNNPFYDKARFLQARYLYWGGMEGANSEEKNTALAVMRDLYERYPECELLQEYVGEPVPWGQEYLADTTKAPKWAAYLREAYARELAILEHFCKHRQAPDGTLGDGFGDDVEMMRKWVPIAAVSSCAKPVRDAIARLADGAWVAYAPYGYHGGIADVEHTAEPTADTFPTMLLINHGDPRYHVYNLKACETISNVMLGTDNLGYPRFKATLIGGEGVIGGLGLQDHLAAGGDTGYHARAMKFFLWLAWYGNAEACDLYLKWVDGWRNTAMTDAPDKPVGVLPGTIWYPSGSYNPPNGEKWYSDKAYNYYGTMGMPNMLHRSFMAAYALSGDRKFLHPIQRMMDYSTYGPYKPEVGEPPSLEWLRSHLAHQGGSTTTALYRMFTGERVYDEYTRRFGMASQVYQIDQDVMRYEESFQKAAESLRHNLNYWTTEVMATDRHHLPAVAEVWGAYTGAVTTTVDAEFPTMGVTYETPDANFAAMVTENTDTRLRVRLYSFWDEPTEMKLKFWRLKPGKYVMMQGEQMPGEKPFQSRYGWSEPQYVEILHKGDLCTITLPRGRTWVVDLRLHEEIDVPEIACDLAIHERDIAVEGDTLTATVHNIGSKGAENFTVALQHKDGSQWHTVKTQSVEHLSQPVGYNPCTKAVTFPDVKSGKWRVVLDPDSTLFELNELNNAAAVTQQERILDTRHD
jgi:hypothetical protein